MADVDLDLIVGVAFVAWLVISGVPLWYLISQVTQLREEIAMQFTDITALLTGIDEATNAVAAKIDAEIATIAELQAQIAAGTPVTQEQLDSLGAALTVQKDKLTALAADPTDPIPA